MTATANAAAVIFFYDKNIKKIIKRLIVIKKCDIIIITNKKFEVCDVENQ